MQHVDYSSRIARSTAEAASGYATAAFAAYADMARWSISFWSNAMNSMVPKPEEPRSWYRDPRHNNPMQLSLGFAQPFNPWASNPWASNAWSASFPFYWPNMGSAPAAFPAANFMMNPVMVWMRAFPLQGPPAAWPMAFALMGWGVPRDVAYPTAAANTAILDAVQTTARAVEQTFATYRTDNGYATAQIRFSSAKPKAPMGWPMAAAFSAPWAAF